jgi:hypothetical protein
MHPILFYTSFSTLLLSSTPAFVPTPVLIFTPVFIFTQTLGFRPALVETYSTMATEVLNQFFFEDVDRLGDNGVENMAIVVASVRRTQGLGC